MCKFIVKSLGLFALAIPLFSVAATDLADKPILAGPPVAGNVVLALSVEFPTALGSSYTGNYNNANDYVGYFDNKKCYDYVGNTDSERRYFEPKATATNHQCSGKWSGNFLNYALTQTIDPLRKALSGGYRSVDTTTLTVLEKAYASGQGGTVNTPAITSNANLYTPFSWGSVKVKIAGLGKKFRITSTGNVDNAGTEIGTASPATIPLNPNATNAYEFYARAQVCKSGMLEDNCTAYGSNYKPTGQIQKNAKKLNFAAFGYLMDSACDDRNKKLDGGVLRAKMAPLGPMVANPGAVDTINPNPEWDETTGIFYTNPDPSDATASGVTNSGVINYLNKFGLTSNKYKCMDPVSELYYSTIRYLKNEGNVPEYTNMAGYTAAEKIVLKDNFPVITNWNDPIKYSCQKNFIIGVGDANTHNDGNLPGSTTPGFSNPKPALVSSDTTVNVVTATNRVGALEGLGTIGGLWGGDNRVRQIAGLAFDSHTVDMRPEATLPGKQTVATYWLDVLESGFEAKNQYWLAAKYGGFDVPSTFNPYAGPTTALPATLWDIDGDVNHDPDNYYRANDPKTMITGLDKAFSSILNSLSGSSNTFSVASASVTSGSMSFATSYKADNWTGDVVASTVTFTLGVPVENLAWKASAKLDAQAAGTGWNTGRRIATALCAAGINGMQTCTGTAFRPANLTALLPDFAALSTDQANAINFLRGDPSNTGSMGTQSFRTRTGILGDIVNSKVVAVGTPSFPFTDTYNPGYSAFKTSKASRSTVAYVGANDGMLHAFDGVSAGGTELFAYVPNAVIKGPTGTPYDNGIGALAKPTYGSNHKFFVDATPVIADVDFGSSDWHSLLIGGLGKGGKTYYALDVTDPATITSETTLSTKVLWEFSHEKMGFTYGRPSVVKTKKYGWTVILTSGYNNADGKGYLFLVNPKTGDLFEMLGTGEGSIANEAGLASANTFVADGRDFSADAVYAGDLLGNVWRFDVSNASTIPAPTKIAAFGSTQPITVPPLIEIDRKTMKRYVFVGTGRILGDADLLDTNPQNLYAILDGTQAKPFTSSTLPAGGSYPVTKSQMVDNTATLASTGVVADSSKPMGYYIDLGFNGTSPFRVNVEMTSSGGLAAAVANSLKGDVCSPTGTNHTYAFTYGGGKSVVKSGASVASYIEGLAGLATSLSFTGEQGSSGSIGPVSIVVSDNTGGTQFIPPVEDNLAGFTTLNWRELPSPD